MTDQPSDDRRHIAALHQRITQLEHHSGSQALKRLDGTFTHPTARNVIQSLLGALWWLSEASDVSQSVPWSDEPHGTNHDTPVEAAAHQHRQHAGIIRRVTNDLVNLTETIHNALDDPQPPTGYRGGTQCKNRGCEQRNRKRQHTPHCGWCGQPLETGQ